MGRRLGRHLRADHLLRPALPALAGAGAGPAPPPPPAVGVGVLPDLLAVQVLGSMTQLQGFSSTSALAHLGGVVVGVVFWLPEQGWGPFERRPAAQGAAG